MGRFGGWRVLPVLVSTAIAAPVAAAPQSADDFLIVDCLLPAQIRQLGLNHTFLAPRQAIRTSANECAIRGGEFTRGDAGGPAGLRMWLPQAQAGNATAETYVGEIFERGLAGRPDYAAAAVWYKRAADQGDAKAAIALGALMEQGLGVPKDPAGAARLFRRAAGLPEELPGDAANVAKLSSELASAQAAGAANERRNAQLSAELRRVRQQLDRREADEKRDRARLADLQHSLAATRQQAPGGKSDQQLKRTLAARERELARTKSLVDRLGAQLAGAETGAAHSSAERDRLERELENTHADVAAKSAEAAQLRSALDAAQHGSAADEDKIDTLGAALAARERELAASQAQADALRDRLAATSRQARQSQTAAADTDQLRHELAAAQKTMAAQQVEASRLEAALAQSEQHGAARTQELQGQLDALKREIKARQDSVTTRDAEIASLKDKLAALETTRSIEPAPKPQPIQQLPFPITAFGRYHALVIGIDHYRKLPQLKTPIDDATAVARMLKQDYGFEVTTLLDANRYQILDALNRLRQTLTDKDNLLIYYAGHGALDRVNQRGNWLPIDAEPDNTANWISNVQITDILNAMAAQQILVVADSCYSGTLTRSVATAISRTLGDAERAQWYKVMISKPSRVALTSGGLEPVADSGGGSHSLFAQMFLRALEQNRSVVAAQQVYAEIEPEIATAGDNTRESQVPEYAPIKLAGHEAGDFLFVRHGLLQ